jgi:type IV pilus assembly protein PilE
MATLVVTGVEAMSKHTGFTLIELLIAMVVISILASIAIPSYSAYIRRGKLAEAPSTLSSYQMKMEQAYPDNGQYLCPVTAIPDTKNFSYTCAAATQTFLLSANGKGQVADVTYTVSELGNKVTTSFNGHSVPASCWLVSGSEC